MPENPTFMMTDSQVIFWHNETDKKYYALRTERDESAMDPFENDPENPVKVACWSPRHELGTPGLVGKLDKTEFWQQLVRENMTPAEIFEKLSKNVPHRFKASINDAGENLINIHMGDEHEVHDYKGVPAANILDYIEDDLTAVECQSLLYDTLVSLPIWIYEHSGITISCGDRTYPYNDQFDSGHLGWAYCTKKALKNTGVEINESDWREVAIKNIRATVKIYDQYLTGDVWWYNLMKSDAPPEAATNESDWEDVDSCGGYYGSDLFASGIADNLSTVGLREAIQNQTYKTGRAKTTYIPQTTFELD